MTKRNMVLRTIRNGKVKINGVWFTPTVREHETSIPYTGQLDGQRWAFGLYYGPKNYETFDENGWNRRVVFMWGSKEAYHDLDNDWPGDNCINGYFQWDWWDTC